MKSICILLFAALTISGCKDLNDIAGSYQVMTADGMDLTDQGVTLTIKIDESGNQISGNSGCNQYSGPFTIRENSTIDLGMMMSTKMYCVEKAEIEDTYMSQLKDIHTAKLKKDVLELMDIDGKVVITAKKKNE